MVSGVLQYFSMVWAKGDNRTWFSLAHGIYPWYWRLFKDQGRQRQMEKACLINWRFVLETVQGLAQSFRSGLANSIHLFQSSFDGVTDPPQLDKGGDPFRVFIGASSSELASLFRFLLNVSWQLLSQPQLFYYLLLLDIIKVPILSLHYDVLWKWNVSKVFDKMSMTLHSAC